MIFGEMRFTMLNRLKLKKKKKKILSKTSKNLSEGWLKDETLIFIARSRIRSLLSRRMKKKAPFRSIGKLAIESRDELLNASNKR